MKRILNLGAGTQSSVLLLMADRGEIEPVDVAIFADTGWEPQAVYEQLEWLKSECSTPITTVSGGDILADAMISQVRGQKTDGHRFASMPLYVKNTGSDREGMIRRQCTREYKIDPIRKYIKTEVLGLPRTARWPVEPVVTQIYGISADEWQRQRKPDGKWVVNEYPLVEMRWTRSKTIEYAETHWPDRVFPRSACIGCPFHSDAEWQHIKTNDPTGWKQAVELDNAIRHADGMNGEVYLHRSLKPLAEIDFRSVYEIGGQGRLFDDECHGICGV